MFGKFHRLLDTLSRHGSPGLLQLASRILHGNNSQADVRHGRLWVERDRSAAVGEPQDEHNGAVVLGTSFEWEITGRLDWDSLYEAQVAFPQVGDTSQRIKTALKYDITRLLFLETAFYWDRVEQPREASDGSTPKSNDFRLTVGFGLQY